MRGSVQAASKIPEERYIKLGLTAVQKRDSVQAASQIPEERYI